MIPFRFTGVLLPFAGARGQLTSQNRSLFRPRKTNKNPKTLSLRKPCCLNLDCPTDKVRGELACLYLPPFVLRVRPVSVSESGLSLSCPMEEVWRKLKQPIMVLRVYVELQAWISATQSHTGNQPWVCRSHWPPCNWQDNCLLWMLVWETWGGLGEPNLHPPLSISFSLYIWERNPPRFLQVSFPLVSWTTGAG